LTRLVYVTVVNQHQCTTELPLAGYTAIDITSRPAASLTGVSAARAVLDSRNANSVMRDLNGFLPSCPWTNRGCVLSDRRLTAPAMRHTTSFPTTDHQVEIAIGSDVALSADSKVTVFPQPTTIPLMYSFRIK